MLLRLPSCHSSPCRQTRSRLLPRGLGRAALESGSRVLPLPSGLTRQRQLVARAKAAEDDGDDDEGPAVPGKAMRVERLLANLGFGRRKECQTMIKRGLVVRHDGSRVRIGDKVTAADVLVDGEPIDDPSPLTIVLNKPVGYVVTSPDDERVLDPTVYDLLPFRWASARRSTPACAAAGGACMRRRPRPRTPRR
jgi:hypothetical protein